MVIQNMLPKEQADPGNIEVPEEYLKMVDYEKTKGSHLADLLTRLDPMRWWGQKTEELSRAS